MFAACLLHFHFTTKFPALHVFPDTNINWISYLSTSISYHVWQVVPGVSTFGAHDIPIKLGQGSTFVHIMVVNLYTDCVTAIFTVVENSASGSITTDRQSMASYHL